MNSTQKKFVFLILTIIILLAVLAIQFATDDLDAAKAFFEIAFAILVAAIGIL